MSAFWAKKLGANPTAPSQPVTVGDTWWQSPPPQQDHRLQPVAPRPAQSARAISSHDSARCPNCNSGNYMRGFNVPEKFAKHCFDCGYPNLQSTSGVSGTGTESVQTAKQLRAFATSVHHGNTVIDHIG